MEFSVVCIHKIYTIQIYTFIHESVEMAKQPILKELEYFVNGATVASTINPTGLSHLVHCGLNLLHNLPASKDAVFEYITIFFDASVAGYVKLMEVSDGAHMGANNSPYALFWSFMLNKYLIL